MVSYAGYSMDNVKQWGCLDKDIIEVDGKIVTNDENVNKQLKNYYEVVTMDTTKIFKWDEENETLIQFA